jgi:hypothetical protein
MDWDFLFNLHTVRQGLIQLFQHSNNIFPSFGILSFILVLQQSRADVSHQRVIASPYMNETTNTEIRRLPPVLSGRQHVHRSANIRIRFPTLEDPFRRCLEQSFVRVVLGFLSGE